MGCRYDLVPAVFGQVLSRYDSVGRKVMALRSLSHGESEARAGGRPVTSERRSSCGRGRSQHDRSNSPR